MEHIIQALELRRASSEQPADCGTRQVLRALLPPSAVASSSQVHLNRMHLEAHRIIGHDVSDPRSRSFDILRTQILQAMDKRSWQFLAVTSPTPACGKTVTAINLALSIARHPDRAVMLVDLDLQKASVATTLGFKPDKGLLSVLNGEITLSEAVVDAVVGPYRLPVLANASPVPHSSALVSSRAMVTALQDLKRSYGSTVVIFDLPPVLAGDDAIAILPHMDAVLFVTAIGTTTLNEVKECKKHLGAAEIVRVVVNKSQETPTTYYY